MMPLNIAHLSDLHLCERVRFEGTRRVLFAFVDHVRERRPDLVLIAGDLGDPRRAPARLSPLEFDTVCEAVQHLAGVCPVVIVRGNHDDPQQAKTLERLSTKYDVCVATEPEVLDIGGAVVHAVPWLSPRWFAEQVKERSLSIDEGHAWIEDATAPLWIQIEKSLIMRPARYHYHVGVGHLSVRGGMLGNGQPLVGHEVQVGADLLAGLGLDYFALGHLHEPQEVAPGVWYAGSPNRLDFGEAGKRCGFLWVTIPNPGASPSVEFVDLPADELACVEAKVVVDDGQPTMIRAGNAKISGAHVRLRVVVPEGLHAEDLIAETVAEIEAVGATVVVERITAAATRQREGATEVAEQRSIADKVRTLLSQRGIDKDQTNRVLDRLHAIEEGGAA